MPMLSIFVYGLATLGVETTKLPFRPTLQSPLSLRHPCSGTLIRDILAVRAVHLFNPTYRGRELNSAVWDTTDMTRCCRPESFNPEKLRYHLHSHILFDRKERTTGTISRSLL